MQITRTAFIAGCIALSGLGYARPAFADYHYVFGTNTFTQPDTDAYARTNGKDTKGVDLNYAYAPDGVNEQAHSPPTLLLFLPGHGSTNESYTDFMTAAVKQGYYVIGLAYRNGQSIQNLCGYWADCSGYMLQQNVDKNTYNGFYEGAENSGQPAASNSVNYRLGAFLSHLKALGIANGFDWKQFYNYGTGDVSWSKIVVAGHSEGGATATWITKNKNVIGGIVFEAPYSDWDNDPAGAPEDNTAYTPCATATSCPYTAHGGHIDVNQFASYLKNDSSNWVNKLWITLSSYDRGYDPNPGPFACDPNNLGVCDDQPCNGGFCTPLRWRGLNMRGAAQALGKSESYLDGAAPTSLDGHKWWTSRTPPTGSCSGHGSTVANGCYPTWMPTYWNLVLNAALQ